MKPEPSGLPRLLIARVAGLPASWMDRFGGDGHLRPLRTLETVELELAEARSSLGERLYEAASSAPPLLRRFLLAVKRDCYNGRSLHPHLSTPEWRELRVRTGPAADRVSALEDSARALREEFETAYARVRESEISHLQALSEHRGLRRGLALASPELLANIPRLTAAPPADWGRRERRACLSLLRYVSRAALKLSPYSSFTRLAMARLTENGGLPTLRLLNSPDEAREVSLVRMRRYLIQQLAALVLRNPTVRDSLPTRLNPSIFDGELGPFRLLRPPDWDFPEGGGPVRFVPPALREVSVGRNIVGWLRDQLQEDTTLSRLRESLGKILGAEEGPVRARSLLDRLAKLGLLFPGPPWSTHHPWLEEELASCLGRLPEAAGLTSVAAPLARIIDLEREFATADDPAAVAQEIEQRFDQAWRAAVASAGLASGTTPHRSKRNEIYEDVVLLAPRSAQGQDELVEIAGSPLDEAMRSVEPWFRLVDLYAPRYELLLTFAAVARRRWPGRDEVGVLELFQEVRTWLGEIRRHVAAMPSPDQEGAGFDPLKLPEVAELRRLRRAIWNGLPQLLEDDGDTSRISAGALQDLLRDLPSHYTPCVGPCAFLQPADAAGELWVLNRIFEGTGRYASRFTPALPEGLRSRFINPLIAASTRWVGDHQVELLDLVSGQGDTLNVHAVQTRRVLTLPGEPISLDSGRRVDATDLRVRLDQPLPFLIDREGRALLPVHLGCSALIYMPPPILFLALFGPGELRPIPVPRKTRKVGDTRVFDRVTLGRVVLARRRWASPSSTPLKLFERPPAQAFEALDHWRRSLNLPERVFAIERVFFEGVAREVFKPQYLDFSSPLFCDLFEAILRTSGDTLMLEEMLPTADTFPRDDRGERWAVELQADTLAWA